MKHGSLASLCRFAIALLRVGSVSAAAISVLACLVLTGCGAPANSTAAGGSFEPQKGDVGAIARKVGEIRESESILALDFSPDAEHVSIKTIASPSIHVWAWRPLSRITRAIAVPKSPGIYEGNPILKYGPDGHLLAILNPVTGIQDQATAIYVWNADTGELLHSVGEPNNFPTKDGLAFSQDQSVLSLYHRQPDSPEHQLVAYNLITRKTSWRISLGSLLAWSLACSPNGSLAAIGGTTGRSAVNPHKPIVIVDLSTHSVLREIDAFPVESTFSHIAWSPDGKQIAAGVSIDASYPEIDSLKTFAVATGERIGQANPPQQNVADLAYGGDGKYLIVSTTGLANVITIWDSSLKSILQTIPLKKGPGSPITTSRDGRFLAIAEGAVVSIWEVK